MSSFEERRAARLGWPIRVIKLGEETLTDPRDTTTPSERIALVATLTRELWALSGLPIPAYSRAEMPGKLVRGRR